MAKKKKKFDDWMPEKPAFVGAQKFTEEQKIARERHIKTQKRLRLARQFSKQGKPRLKKET